MVTTDEMKTQLNFGSPTKDQVTEKLDGDQLPLGLETPPKKVSRRKKPS
jgi:hypothetical protein